MTAALIALSLACSTAAQATPWPPQMEIWRSFIEREAAATGLSPALVASVIWVESRGWAGAVSRSGACGLMQVMASDTATVHPELFADRPTCAALLDPAFNVTWGTRYLATLYQVYGNQEDALIHYYGITATYLYAESVLLECDYRFGGCGRAQTITENDVICGQGKGQRR